jgi:hypothetical protein
MDDVAMLRTIAPYSDYTLCMNSASQLFSQKENGMDGTLCVHIHV